MQFKGGKIPCIYLIIAGKILEKSNEENRMKMAELRTLLGKYFRIPKDKRSMIIHELHEYAIIRCMNSEFCEVLYGIEW